MMGSTSLRLWLFYGVLCLCQSAVADDVTVPEACRPAKIVCWAGDPDGLEPPSGPSPNAVSIHHFLIEGLAVPEQAPGPFQGSVEFYERNNDFSNLRLYHQNRLNIPDNPWLQQRMYERTGLRSGPLIKGDIIPISGTLYEVIHCAKSDAQFGSAEITLTRLPLDRWPDDVVCDDYAYAITPGGFITVPSRSIGPKGKVYVSWRDQQSDFELKTMHEIQISSSATKFHTETFNASSGVAFPLGVGGEVYHFKVVHVVNPNPESHIPGWVEVRRVWPKIEPFGVPAKVIPPLSQ
jgi:hypothetical protein